MLEERKFKSNPLNVVSSKGADSLSFIREVTENSGLFVLSTWFEHTHTTQQGAVDQFVIWTNNRNNQNKCI